MDLGRPTGKDPPIPSRRSTGGGVGGSQPIPHPQQTSLNLGSRGSPTRNEDSPPTQEDRPPPTLRSTPSHTGNDPPPISASSNAQLCKPCIPAKELQLMCVPAHLLQFYQQQEQHDNQQTANEQPPGFSRQSTYVQQDVYSDQGAYGRQEYRQESTFGHQEYDHKDVYDQQQEYRVAQEKSSEIKSQRSKSSSAVQPTPRTTPKFQTKLQKLQTTERPPWRVTSRNMCKPPGIYPEPFKPLPPVSKPTSAVAPVRQHHSESQMSMYEYQTSVKRSSMSTQPTSARLSQASAKQNLVNVRQSQVSAKHGETRRSSRVSNTATNTDAGFHQDIPSTEDNIAHLNRLADDAGLFSTAESRDNVRFRDERHVLAGIEVRRSSERVNIQRNTDEVLERDSLSRPVHFQDENVRFDAENEACTAGPNRRSSERLQEECETIMQKLTAELALSGGFPSKERLCVRVSLGEQVTSDGHRKSFTICEPRHSMAAEQAQEDGPEVYATPSASTPKVSAQFENVKPNDSIPEAKPEDSSSAEVKCIHEEPEGAKEVVPNTNVVFPAQEVPMPTSIEEILPPPTEKASPTPTRTILTPSFEAIMASASKPFLSSEPLPPTPADAVRTEPVAKPKERPGKDPQVHLDKESSTGIKTKTIENEALNTEFLYYSSALKNLLPVLSCPDDRCRLVPWVKKLFSPEYCARLLRDKRNRFLLHLTLVLCNDEVIGVFRKPPPEGIIPSVDELCSTRYPPATWECDSAWLDHLEDVPPGVSRMPCPWHSSGCPAPDDQAADATDSNEGLTCPEICYPWRQYGTGNETSFGWSLDQEFKLLLCLARPLKPLMKVSRDRQRMTAWLRFLCTVTPDCCVALRLLRNDYAKLLLAYGQDDRMTGPFANDPVWGQALPPLEKEGDGRQARSFADPASGDVDEFLRSVPVPNEGAFCYVAVDGVPVTPITRPTASASLLQR